MQFRLRIEFYPLVFLSNLSAALSQVLVYRFYLFCCLHCFFPHLFGACSGKGAVVRRLGRPGIRLLFSSYAFAIFMLVGVREAISSERISSRLVNQLLILVAMLAAVSVGLFLGSEGPYLWKDVVQQNLRLLFIGAALVVAGIWLFGQPSRVFVGKWVALAILVWGSLLVILALLAGWLGDSPALQRVMLIGRQMEFLFQTLLGLGSVVWMQNDERIINQELTAKTHYLDTHDQLTGALNRDALLRDLSALIQQPVQQPLLLVMLGLDRFKTVNETVGLKQGDRILREVTRRFEASVLKPCLVARTGGDIFAVVLRLS